MISGASDNFSNPEVLGNNGLQQWQNLTWQPIHINGGQGEDNQEIYATPAPTDPALACALPPPACYLIRGLDGVHGEGACQLVPARARASDRASWPVPCLFTRKAGAVLRPAPRRIVRAVAGVLLRIAAGIAAFAILVTAGTYAVHGLILVVRAIP